MITLIPGFSFGLGVVGVALLVFCLVAWFCVLLLCVSAWWNRGILDEVTKASYGRAVTGTAVMARSANEEKKKKKLLPGFSLLHLGFKRRFYCFLDNCWQGGQIHGFHCLAPVFEL